MERWLEQNPSIIVLCITLPFSLVGVYLLYSAWSARRRVQRSQQWPTTTGRIVHSGIEAIRRHKSSGVRHIYTAYYPQITYEYQAGGQVYQGSALTLGSRVGSQSLGDAQQMVARYPLGATVDVHYDPDDPADCALERAAPFNWVIALVGLGLVLLPVFVALVLGFPGLTSGLK